MKRLTQRSSTDPFLMSLCILCIGFFSGCRNESYSIAEEDMTPTYKLRDWYDLERFDEVNSVKRWNVVRFQEPKETRNRYRVLRVIGLPGDKLKLNFYGIWINGELHNQTYPGISYVFNRKGIGVEETIEIPDGMYFLLGDNYRDSRDSRHFGLVSGELIIGKVVNM